MIKFSFADLQDTGKFKGYGFGGAQNIVIDGMNIAGNCTNKMKDGKGKCGAFIVLPIGFIDKAEQTSFEDIKKLASFRLRNKHDNKKLKDLLKQAGVQYKVYENNQPENNKQAENKKEPNQRQKCMKCDQPISLNSLNTAIFSNCRYEFQLLGNDQPKNIKGIVGYADGYQTFDQGHSDIHGLIGKVFPLTDVEKIEEEFVGWLWDHDF